MANEKRLIDAKYLEKRMCEVCNELRSDEPCEPADCACLGLIRKLIPVDAVEVVRCKDCAHYMTIHCTCDGCCISDDWYCADGERRTDNDYNSRTEEDRWVE